MHAPLLLLLLLVGGEAAPVSSASASARAGRGGGGGGGQVAVEAVEVAELLAPSCKVKWRDAGVSADSKFAI